MGKYHLRGSHVSLIARTHVRYSIRGGSGLVFVLLCLLAGLVMASFVVDGAESATQNAHELLDATNSAAPTTPEEKRAKEALNKQFEAQIEKALTEIGRSVIGAFTSADDEQVSYLVDDKPALVSAFIVLFVFFLPFILCLGAFNQYAGDVASRGMRYQLLRTERANIYIGRFLGTYVFTLLTLAGLMAIVTLFLVFKAQFYPAGDVLLWMLQTFLAVALYALPWIALCGWISSAIDSPFGSLALSLVLIILYPLIIFIGSKTEAAVGYGSYALPWGWKWWLLHPSTGTFLIGVLAMLGFTAVFGWLGLHHFTKRDL